MMQPESTPQALAGNWKRFPHFAWAPRQEVPHPEQWTILYFETRDSPPADRRRMAAVERALQPFMEGKPPTTYSEHHRHWGLGWVHGVSVQVYDDQGKLTPAFRRVRRFLRRKTDGSETG